MDMQTVHGWRNDFTWLVYSHVSSEEEMMNAMRLVIAEASYNRRNVEEEVYTWVQAMFDTWTESCEMSVLQGLWVDIGHAALRQIDWRRFVEVVGAS